MDRNCSDKASMLPTHALGRMAAAFVSRLKDWRFVWGVTVRSRWVLGRTLCCVQANVVAAVCLHAFLLTAPRPRETGLAERELLPSQWLRVVCVDVRASVVNKPAR